MSMADLAILRAVLAQAIALKEQALALGMQAETLEKTVGALVDQAHVEGVADAPVLRPPPAQPRYFNQERPNVQETAQGRPAEADWPASATRAGALSGQPTGRDA